MLEIKDLSVKTKDKIVLNKFDLKMNKGEIHVLMGPNGIGKSTICKTIMGHPDYEVTSGSIKYNHQDLQLLETEQRAQAGIFYLNQSPKAIAGVTNAEMLRASLTSKGKQMDLIAFNEKIKSICDDLHLNQSFIHKDINVGASGGEKKKIEMMHLWMIEPSFIILDEIDSGLDVDSLKIVGTSLKKYYEKFKPTILIITHHINILKYLQPDFVHVMQDGTISLTGNYNLAKKIEKEGFQAIEGHLK